MKKDLQRAAALCLSAVMVLSLFTGCGRKASSARHDTTQRKRSNSSSVSGTLPKETLPPVPEETWAPEPTETWAPATVPAETQEREPLVYMDERVAQYTGTDPQWQTLEFQWDTSDGMATAMMTLTVDARMYQHYRSLGRYYGVENYALYVNEENNVQVIRQVVSALRDVAEDLSYGDAAVAREIAKFVQDCIEYQYDSDTTGADEYPRYPIETLYERQGDCEDTSILMAALLKEWGYEVGFLHLPGHVAVALRTADNYSGGPYYEINGHRYLYIESTGSGWRIGDIPDDCKNVQAEFHLIP